MAKPGGGLGGWGAVAPPTKIYYIIYHQHLGLIEKEKHTGFEKKHTGFGKNHTGFDTSHTGFEKKSYWF